MFCLSLIKCLLQNVAFPTGIDFQMKTIRLGSTSVTLQLWDTAGQERSEIPVIMSSFFFFFFRNFLMSFFSRRSDSAASRSSTTARLRASWPCTTLLTSPLSPPSEAGWIRWRWALPRETLTGAEQPTTHQQCLLPPGQGWWWRGANAAGEQAGPGRRSEGSGGAAGAEALWGLSCFEYSN